MINTSMLTHAQLPYIPWQTPVNANVMKKVEQRVIKQLLQALMYEEIIEFHHEPTQQENGLLTFRIECPQHETTVSYTAQGYIHDSFGIIRLTESDVLRRINGKEGDIASQSATLEMVIHDILLTIEGASLRDGFIKELRQTFINDIQAVTLAIDSPSIDDMSYDQLESHLMAGHPYHPCYKSRLGFSLLDNFQYGPEFSQDIDVVWLAVEKSLLATNSIFAEYIANSNDWIKQYIGESNYIELLDKLTLVVHELSEDYGLIPAHPWQWQNTLINALQPLIQSQQIVYLGSVAGKYHAQQSIRSLSLMSADDNNPDKTGNVSEKDYLKLAMHLTNTSSTRILAKHTVMNASVITRWLNTLIKEDEVAQDLSIAFLGENIGISLDHEVLQNKGYSHADIYGGLGAIWRENVNKYLSGKQRAFPLNGVSYIQPNGQKLIDPWLQQHGVENWIKQLIIVTVSPLIHLLFAHGVALESHAQNIVLVHENGYPIKILLKDLHDGVRYSPAHLTQPELAPKLYSLPEAHAKLNRGSFIETDDTNGIRDMAVACLFFVALADIAIFMQKHYGFVEQEFWQQVANCVDDYQQANPQHQARFKLFDVFAKQTRIESLAKRRLFGDSAFPIKFIDNPLYATRR